MRKNITSMVGAEVNHLEPVVTEDDEEPVKAQVSPAKRGEQERDAPETQITRRNTEAEPADAESGRRYVGSGVSDTLE